VVIGWLFFGVVRPLLRQAAERVAVAPAALPLPAPEQVSIAPMGSAGDPLQRARQLARDDPKVVANVVKGWVTRDE
jgi:flagellar M-ring protein FliF